MLLNSSIPQRFICSLLPLALASLVTNSALSADGYTETPGTEGNGNHTIGPHYHVDPDLTDRGNPKGKYFEFSMPLADSKIFRGDDATLDRLTVGDGSERTKRISRHGP